VYADRTTPTVRSFPYSREFFGVENRLAEIKTLILCLLRQTRMESVDLRKCSARRKTANE
jgi:hypothetical protein